MEGHRFGSPANGIWVSWDGDQTRYAVCIEASKGAIPVRLLLQYLDHLRYLNSEYLDSYDLGNLMALAQGENLVVISMGGAQA